MEELQSRDKEISQIAKSWAIAMATSRDRLQRIDKLQGDEMDAAVQEGRLILETVCLFVHASLRCGQFSLPAEFWRILHTEYGILVYPSALTENVDTQGVGIDKTLTDCYRSHVVMLGRCCSDHPPPCPFEYLREPPPPYHQEP